MQLEFEAGDNKEYEVDGIQNSAVYAKESVSQLPGLYYLVLWKGYSEKENTWEPALAIHHLWKLVTTYHQDNLEKPIATSAPVDTAPPIARPFTLLRPTAKPTTAPTKKRGQLVGSTTTNKRAKKS